MCFSACILRVHMVVARFLLIQSTVVCMKQVILLIILCISFGTFRANAVTSGKVTGFVLDKATHDPLAGVTIRVKGTELIAISGLNGEYFILNIPLGTYTVEVQMIGYLPIQTQEFMVNSNRTTRIDFELETTILDLAEPAIITASKRSKRSDLTASSELIIPKEIESLPVKDISDLIFLQNGVIRDATGNLHIRGGRANEISYYVDGASLEDPLLGGLGTHIQLDSVAEVVINRGGFNAEYGEAMSGVVNIVTREGVGPIFGSLRGVANMKTQYDSGPGPYEKVALGRGGQLGATLGGALPWLEKKGGYFFSGKMLSDRHHISNNSRSLTTISGNLVFRPYPLLKLKISGHFYQEYQRQKDFRNQREILYDFNTDGPPEKNAQSYGFNLSISQTISPQFFYTARFYRYTSKNTLISTILPDTYWRDRLDHSENHKQEANSTTYEYDHLKPDRSQGLPSVADRDFLQLYRNSGATYYGVRTDLSGQITYWNEIRAGAEVQWYRLILNEKSFLQTVPHEQRYAISPAQGAIYFQDKLELHRLIVNAGIRLDYLDTSQHFFVNLPTGLAEQKGNSKKIRFSPRLGISHSLSSRSLLRFNYGYFYQPPEFKFAYVRLEQDQSRNLPASSPDLMIPQKTVAYEFGLEHMLTRSIRLGLTASYKTILNRTLMAQAVYPDGTYNIFNNADLGSVRSLEFTLKRDMSHVLSGSLNYTYSFAGRGGTSLQGNESLTNQSQNGSSPLSFDQRHTMKVVFNFLAPNIENKTIGGIWPLHGWGLTFVGYYGSGLPYIPTNTIGKETEYAPDQVSLPAVYNIDLRLRKRMKSGRLSYTLFSEVRNLLDRKNVLGIYANSNRSKVNGAPSDSQSGHSRDFLNLSRILNMAPQYYAPPREIRFGFELAF